MQNEQNGYVVLRKHTNPRAVRLFRSLVNAYHKQASPEAEMVPEVEMVFNTPISRDEVLKQEQDEGQEEPQSKNHKDQLRNLKSTLKDLKKGFRLLKTNAQDKKRFRDRIQSIERKIRKWEHYKARGPVQES